MNEYYELELERIGLCRTIQMLHEANWDNYNTHMQCLEALNKIIRGRKKNTLDILKSNVSDHDPRFRSLTKDSSNIKGKMSDFEKVIHLSFNSELIKECLDKIKLTRSNINLRRTSIQDEYCSKDDLIDSIESSLKLFLQMDYKLDEDKFKEFDTDLYQKYYIKYFYLESDQVTKFWQNMTIKLKDFVDIEDLGRCQKMLKIFRTILLILNSYFQTCILSDLILDDDVKSEVTGEVQKNITQFGRNKAVIESIRSIYFEHIGFNMDHIKYKKIVSNLKYISTIKYIRLIQTSTGEDNARMKVAKMLFFNLSQFDIDKEWYTDANLTYLRYIKVMLEKRVFKLKYYYYTNKYWISAVFVALPWIIDKINVYVQGRL